MRIFLAFLLSTLSMLAHAGIGSVIELTGTAIIKRNKESISVSTGTEVEMNDRVETKNGKVKIEFRDKTSVTVTEHSTLVIDDFVYDPKSSAGRISLKAAEGTVRYVSGAIAKNDPKNVNIKTPTATIAVRGTDFVMSVNEIGSSLVILMPSCDNNSCVSGIIDVSTAFGSVTMDRPYMATMVEGAAAPPTPPVVVNLSNSAIGNNLQITPPATTAGTNVISAAREAAAKTGDSGTGKTVTADAQSHQETATANVTTVDSNTVEPKLATEITIVDSTTDKPVEEQKTKEEITVTNARKVMSDLGQVNWVYERLMGNNYVNIKLPSDTKINVVVSQDRQLDTYNFGTALGQGTIIINQTYR